MTQKYSATYIARSFAIASRLLGGEMMIMSTVDSTFFTLNPVATVIWQAADGCTPLSELVAQRVCTEFEVDFDTAQHDVECFVEELSRHGILLVSDRPFPESATSPTEAA
jgi:Coenzyme PQQ synthesis protein D (PqqD)